MKKILALLLAMMMVLGLVACGGTDTGSQPSNSANTSVSSGDVSTDEEDTYKVFVFGSDANCTTFSTVADLQNNSGGALQASVGETLWTVDNEGNVECVLAESYEWTGDLELTIKLREGVTFSNGNPLTAEDVYYTLTMFRDGGRTASMVAAIDFENTVCDGNTIVLALNKYDAALFNTLGNNSFMIVDQETVSAEGFNHSWLYGTGAYKLKGDGVTDKSGWEESVQYTLVRNENYWGEQPYYDEIIIKFFSEESTRYAEFQAGNLDACYLTEATYINNVGSGSVDGTYLIQLQSQAVSGIQFSAGKDSCGAMADINVRKAFVHALDIPAIVETLGEGIYGTATSILGEANWAYSNVGTYSYDPDYAAECLAAAGYSVDNPLTLQVVAESTAFNSAVAEACQAYLAEIGINLDLSGMGDFPTILPVLLSGTQQVGMGSASSNSGNDPASLLQQFGPLSDNVMLRRNEDEMAPVFTDAAASRDHAERVQLYAEYQKLMNEGYYFLPMWVETKNYAASDEHPGFANALDGAMCFDATMLVD